MKEIVQEKIIIPVFVKLRDTKKTKEREKELKKKDTLIYENVPRANFEQEL